MNFEFETPFMLGIFIFLLLKFYGQINVRYLKHRKFIKKSRRL